MTDIIDLTTERELEIQGYWQDNDGRNAELYFNRNCLQDIVIFDTLSPRAAEFRRNMLDRDNRYKNRRIDLFPWQNFAELAVLLQYHNSNVTWQHLWMKPYNEIWPLSFRQANPLHEELFHVRRQVFLTDHVKTIWPIQDGDWYLVHLRSEIESGHDEHERLSSGFIVMPKSVCPEFFSAERATTLMESATEDGYTYPWHNGEQAMMHIVQHGAMTVSMLV